MQKKKTSLKKRIFALVGVVAVLLSLSAVIVSAVNDDGTGGLSNTDGLVINGDNYFNVAHIPYYPYYRNRQDFHEITLGGDTNLTTKVPQFNPYIKVGGVDVNTDLERGYVIQLGSLRSPWENTMSYGTSSTDNGIVSSTTTTLHDMALAPYFEHYTRLTIPNELDNYSLVFGGEDFWIYPRSDEGCGLSGDEMYGTLFKFGLYRGATGGIPYQVEIDVKWRFLGSDMPYYSSFGGTHAGTVDETMVEVNYFDLIIHCNERQLSGNYDFDIDQISPIYIESFEVAFKFNSPYTDMYQVYIDVPCMTKVQHNLKYMAMDYTYKCGAASKGFETINTDFDLTMIFEAVGDVLAVPFIGGFSLGNLLYPFIALAIVLAVLSLFRGST